MGAGGGPRLKRQVPRRRNFTGRPAAARLGGAGSRRPLRPAVAALCGLLFTLTACDLPPPGPPPSFSADIAPLLDRHCVACHGPDKVRGGYRLDTFAALAQPGKSGSPALVPGQPARSDLYIRLIHEDPEERMPYDAPPLAAEEITLIRRWIAAGASFDGADPRAPLASLRPRPEYPPAPEHYAVPPPVTALAWRPGHDELAVGGRHEVLLLNPATLAPVKRLAALPERMAALAWSPDGARLAVAGGAPGRNGELVLVDPGFSTAPRMLVVARDLVLSAAFSPDGGALAATGTDGRVLVFALTNLLARALPPHADWAHAVAWSPDGARLVTASRDRTARVLDAASGEVLATYRRHQTAVEHAAFGADGQTVFTAGTDRRVRRWSVEKPDDAGDFARFDVPVTALAVAGEMVFIGLSEGTLTQRRLAERDEVRTWPQRGDRVTALAIEPESGRLAAGYFSGLIRVFDVKEGALLAEARPWP